MEKLNCENFCWYSPLSQQCQDPDILPGEIDDRWVDVEDD